MADYSANAVVPLALSVFMLLAFQNLQISRGKKLIRLLASATLGVYLFHDNVNFRVWLWPNVYRLVSGIGLESFALNAVLCVIAVFVLGCTVEMYREITAKALRNKVIKR